MKQKMHSRRALPAVALSMALLATLSVSKAGTDVSDTNSDTKQVAAPTMPAVTSAISGDIGVAVKNIYDSRGYALVTRGGCFQPYLDLYLKAYSSDGFINSITPTIGFWSDINTYTAGGNSSPTSGLRNWYEFDYMPGIAIGFAKHFTLTESFFEFDSPSGGFKTARSFNSSLSYDDSGLIDKSKNFSLQPHLTILQELNAPGSAGKLPNGEYFEAGIAPNYTVFRTSQYPITFTIPVLLAYGNHFYTSGFSFGYVSTGLSASVPLKFIPQQFGSWSANTSYTYYHTATAVNAGAYQNQNIFSVGVGCTF